MNHLTVMAERHGCMLGWGGAGRDHTERVEQDRRCVSQAGPGIFSVGSYKEDHRHIAGLHGWPSGELFSISDI